MGTNIRIHVLPEDIKAADGATLGNRCPVAQAIIREYPSLGPVWVSMREVYKNFESVTRITVIATLPQIAIMNIHNYDRGSKHRMSPFEFELEIRDDPSTDN